MKFRAQIIVRTKPSIKDIKALTLKQAVGNLFEVEDFNCHAGNVYWLDFCADSKAEAQKIAETIAQEILANQVIEDYEILIEND